MSDKSQKLELTAIKPGMTFEEVERNLVGALQRSGIRVDGYDADGKPIRTAQLITPPRDTPGSCGARGSGSREPREIPPHR